MLLAVFVPFALAASPITDVEFEAAQACPADRGGATQPPCAAADALFDRLYLEGAPMPPAPTRVVAVIRAFEAGRTRLAAAPDRAAVDADVAAILATVDAGTGPDQLPIVQTLFLTTGEALLDTYRALPGPVGPQVAAALDRPARDRALAVDAVEGGCIADVDLVADARAWGELPRPEPFRSEGHARCRTLADQLRGADVGSSPQPLGVRMFHPTAQLMLESQFGRDWLGDAAVAARADRVDAVLAYEAARRELRR
jgi:hypothetical protein